MNPYRHWGVESREEYMAAEGGFHSATMETLRFLLDNVDNISISKVEMFIRWASGEPGSNFLNANQIVRDNIWHP